MHIANATRERNRERTESIMATEESFDNNSDLISLKKNPQEGILIHKKKLYDRRKTMYNCLSGNIWIPCPTFWQQFGWGSLFEHNDSPMHKARSLKTQFPVWCGRTQLACAEPWTQHPQDPIAQPHSRWMGNTSIQLPKSCGKSFQVTSGYCNISFIVQQPRSGV